MKLFNRNNTGNSRIIANKSYDTIEKKVDFLSSYSVFEKKEDVPIIGYLYLTKDVLSRLDIIVGQYYGSMDMLDLFLKFNEIDDMFAAPIGKKLLIPDAYALQECYKCISTETTCSLNKNKENNRSFGRKNNLTSSVSSKKTAKEKRGVGFTVIKPGVIAF